MKQNVVLQALVRLAASVVALAVLALPALAGDRALIDFIGYSDDGRYFAFEEYGVQDGSGFAYSTIYLIDLRADRWAGSPFHLQAGEEEWDKPLAEVRDENREVAATRLGELGIGRPVEIFALIGDGVHDDGKQIVFGNPMCCWPGNVQEDRVTLDIETFPVKPTDDYCMDADPVGYALTVTDADGARELHRDGTTLPRSRGCTLDYRLYAVLAPFEASAPRVAIISSYPFGFEGPDRRFLAVPIDR